MKVNGNAIVLEKQVNLYSFLVEQNYDLTRIAVERNGEIVSQSSFSEVLLEEQDTLEIVRFVGGG